MAIAFWNCCGQTWASESRFCPKCRGAGVKIAEGDGTPTDAGKELLGYYEERAGREFPVSYGRRKFSGRKVDKYCYQCGRLKAGVASGGTRKNGTTTHQKFIQPGMVEVCVGGPECKGYPARGPKEKLPAVRTMGVLPGTAAKSRDFLRQTDETLLDRDGNLIPEQVFDSGRKRAEIEAWWKAREERGW